jgi:hypothetical protein
MRQSAFLRAVWQIKSTAEQIRHPTIVEAVNPLEVEHPQSFRNCDYE